MIPATQAPPSPATVNAPTTPTYLIEVLVPLFDGRGRRLPLSEHERVRGELLERFGGLTAHLRAPANGLWKPRDDDTPVEQDIVSIYEVMAPDLDRPWWKSFRNRLERRFRQEEIVVRARRVERL